MPDMEGMLYDLETLATHSFSSLFYHYWSILKRKHQGIMEGVRDLTESSLNSCVTSSKLFEYF